MSQNTPEKEHIQLSAEILESQEAERLDVAVSALFSQYSRSRLQLWIKSGEITLDGKPAKSREKVHEGQKVVLDVLLEAEPDEEVAENISLDIVYEDEISHVAYGRTWLNKWKEDKSLWEYYLEHLPENLTPSRAKGMKFDHDSRVRAGLGENFIHSVLHYKDDFVVTDRKQWKK